MASFNAYFTNVGATSATFIATFSGGDASYSKYRYINLSIQGIAYPPQQSQSAGGADSYFYFVVNGLTPSSTYTWNAVLCYTDGESLYQTDYVASGTLTTKSSITKWSWTSSNGSASAVQTNNAYKVLTGQITTNNFSYLVWNDIVDKVNVLLVTNGLSWNNYYASYSGTKVYRGDTLSAARFNSIKYNIEQVVATGLPIVTKESILYGYYITALTDAINNAIG